MLKGFPYSLKAKHRVAHDGTVKTYYAADSVELLVREIYKIFSTNTPMHDEKKRAFLQARFDLTFLIPFGFRFRLILLLVSFHTSRNTARCTNTVITGFTHFHRLTHKAIHIVARG